MAEACTCTDSTRARLTTCFVMWSSFTYLLHALVHTMEACSPVTVVCSSPLCHGVTASFSGQ